MAYDGRGLRFGSVAEDYDRYRPSPPAQAAEVLGDVEGLELLEVGAGTGLWTRFLEALGAKVTVIEPDDEMRAVLRRRSPGIVAIAGTAEALPFDDASFDAVLASSAWHWFEQPAATNEMARVLRDGGRLFVLWNGFSRDVAWISDVAELRERSNDANKRPRGWRVAFDGDLAGPFEEAKDVEVHWVREMTVDDLVELFSTFSGEIIRDDDDRKSMQDEVRRRVAEHEHDGVVDVPMTLRGTVARRRAR